MTDTLRARLAHHTTEPGPTRLILALAHELPADVEHWSATATLGQLAERCGVNERTVRRWRDRLPDLPWLELTSSSRGYHLRISLTGHLASPHPADIPPGPHPISTSAPALSGQLTREDARTLLGQMAVMARTLVGQYPDILDSLPGHDVDILRTLAGQEADTARTLPGHLADKEGTLNGHSADIPRTSSGHSADITRTSSGHYSDIKWTLPGHFADISHVGARTITPPVHAPVILQRDSLRSSLLSEQAGQPGARVGVPAHEGAHTHEACLLAGQEGQVGEDDQEQLVAWLSVELEERTEDITRGEAMPKPKAIARTARLLLSRLERLEVAQAFVQQRFADLATRRWETLPSDRRTLLDWLGKDSANAEQRALALAAAQPATLPASAPQAAAQQAAYVAPRGRRERFRAPQFAEAFEAIAQPAEPVAPEQERQSWREQLRVELSMPSHHRQDELVELLVARLGDEGQQLLKESQAAQHVEPLESEASSDQPAEPEAPDDVEEAPSALELPQASAAAAPSEAKGAYAPFPFAQLSQELGYNRSAPKRPDPCLDVVKLWPSLLDAVRAHGPRGHSMAKMLEGAKHSLLDVEAQQLRVALEDADFVSHIMSFEMMPYRIALLDRLEQRTTKPGWRLIAHLAQSQEEAG